MKIKEVKELETKDLVEKIENAETALAKMKLNHQIIRLRIHLRLRPLVVI